MESSELPGPVREKTNKTVPIKPINASKPSNRKISERFYTAWTHSGQVAVEDNIHHDSVIT